MVAKADYIVVGGGLTGCAVAARIKQSNPSLSVLIIEAGPDPTADRDIVTPYGGFALTGTELDWQYQTASVPTLHDRTFTLSAGRTLGGGSVLNYGGWSRASRHDYDDWAQMVGDSRWSYDGLLPYMRRSERFSTLGVPDQHGYDGPFKVTSVADSDPQRRYPLRDMVEAGWSELGVQKIHNPCSGEVDGLSEIYENWDGGKRQPAQLAYHLADVGVEVMSDCAVSKVVVNRQSVVTGVELANGRTVLADREVIISAGSFQTPTLLLRSGIDVEGTGQNYSDHFCIYQIWKVKAPERGLALGHPSLTTPALFNGLPGDWIVNEAPPRDQMEKALDADGVTGAERENLLRPGRTFIETGIYYTSLMPGVPPDGTYLTSSTLLTVPTSRGQVNLSPDDAETPRPHISPNFFTTAFDKLCLSYGAKRLAKVMLGTSAMKPYIECEVPPLGMAPITPSSTDEEILDRIDRVGTPHYHPMGTCAMGTVVDTDLRVKGVKGLRLCDASIFPGPIGGHPMATLYAVAEQAAEIITGKA